MSEIKVESSLLASVIARTADNKIAKDITILNIQNVSVITDYFVICSAASPTQVRAITASIKENVKKIYNRYPTGEEHDAKNRWNLIDYGDVIVHVLHKEEREAYAIEKFWNHALKVNEENWMAQTEDMKEKLM